MFSSLRILPSDNKSSAMDELFLRNRRKLHFSYTFAFVIGYN